MQWQLDRRLAGMRTHVRAVQLQQAQELWLRQLHHPTILPDQVLGSPLPSGRLASRHPRPRISARRHVPIAACRLASFATAVVSGLRRRATCSQPAIATSRHAPKAPLPLPPLHLQPARAHLLIRGRPLAPGPRGSPVVKSVISKARCGRGLNPLGRTLPPWALTLGRRVRLGFAGALNPMRRTTPPLRHGRVPNPPRRR